MDNNSSMQSMPIPGAQPVQTPAMQPAPQFAGRNVVAPVMIDDKKIMVSSDEVNEKYNSDNYNPIDGEIIRGCDHLSAYIEAYMSLKYGVQSEQMQSVLFGWVQPLQPQSEQTPSVRLCFSLSLAGP